jgi:hypothetical protein
MAARLWSFHGEFNAAGHPLLAARGSLAATENAAFARCAQELNRRATPFAGVF